MPRTARVELAGGIHHVTGRTPTGRLLYRDTEDRETYLRLLTWQSDACGWEVLSYCLMGNHLHLLVRTPDTNLGQGMKQAHELFASFVNEKYDEHGHVFGDRFRNKIVHDERHLLGCFRYIARNPIAAGLCETPDDWDWSAHRALTGEQPPPALLDMEAALAALGPNPVTARAAYARLTANDDDTLLRRLEGGSGSDVWIAEAIDDFQIPIDVLARHLRVSRRTAYRRVAVARNARGT